MNMIAIAASVLLTFGSFEEIQNTPLVVRDITSGEKIVRSTGQNVVRRIFTGEDVEFSVGPGRPGEMALESLRETIFGTRSRSFRRFGTSFVDDRSIPFAGFKGEDSFLVRSSFAPLASNDILVATFSTLQQKMRSFTMIADGNFNDGDVIEAFVDENSNASFDPGEPYGAEKISGESSYIELSRTSPSIIRLNVLDVLSAAEPLANNPTASDAIKNAVFEAAVRKTDRGRHPDSFFSVMRPDFIGTNITFDTSASHRLRIIRSAINGLSDYDRIPFDGIVIDRHLSIADHPMLTEADLVSEGQLDLDWFSLTNAAKAASYSWKAITNATYRIVVFEGTIDPKARNNNLAVTIINKFEYGQFQSPVNLVGVTKNASQPTFTWKHENTIGKPYPAFRLRVWDATGTTLVYDSGNVRAPARDKNGVYSWTAKDAALATGTTYKWGVSMLDAKFVGPLDSSREGSAVFTW